MSSSICWPTLCSCIEDASVEILFEEVVVGLEQVVSSATIWIASDQVGNQSLDCAAALAVDTIFDAIELTCELIEGKR